MAVDVPNDAGGQTISPGCAHTRFMEGLKAAVDIDPDMPSIERLAIAAQFLGMVLAFQDDLSRSPDSLMATISRNIEIGNATAMHAFMAVQAEAEEATKQ